MEILDQPLSLRETIVNESPKIESASTEVIKRKISRIHIVGMGSSYSAALVGKTFSDSVLSLPVEVWRGYEFEYQNPRNLSNSLVIPLSFSGETEDVVSSLQFGKKAGALTISISGPEESTLSRDAHVALQIVSRDTKAMVAAHRSQIALLYLLLGQIAMERGDSNRVASLRRRLSILTNDLESVIKKQEAPMRKLAEEFSDSDLFYVISAGPNFGLAYKLGMTELTENAWCHSVVQYSTEFRHGIVEKIEKGLPMIFIVGTDASRVDVLREMKTCEKLQARLIVWDAKNFPETDPFLTPFYLSACSEWFVYYLSLKRGKLPSTRRYMGNVIPYADMKSLKDKFAPS
jgi:glucosamine--fructose-6-phosphate aminotransferase (isomerizing)